MLQELACGYKGVAVFLMLQFLNEHGRDCLEELGLELTFERVGLVVSVDFFVSSGSEKGDDSVVCVVGVHNRWWDHWHGEWYGSWDLWDAFCSCAGGWL